MRFQKLLFLLLLPLTLVLSAQTDPSAKAILDKFADKALKAPSVSMKFNLITVSQEENTKDTLNGTVILSKDKYKLDLPDNSIWFNGETSWSYLPAEKEVTITKADRKDNSFQSKPSQIFSMYKKGYKTRLIEEKANSYVIDLYPEDLKNELMRVRLTISKSLDLVDLEYKRKDGTIVTLIVKEYDLKVKPASDTFVFQQADYKGVEINDIR